MVILTGITGAVGAPWVLDRIGIREPAVRGFAMGLVSHGIGTARAFQVNETAGAFAGIGMGLNAVLTSIIAPLALHLFQ